ncbi:acyltransferase-domain-containing protein [Heliocybe sulcata]|uniref:Acyltransferase-domain-containing protein n=1 Tax=Heliocybe sulcata TaxID=5364 RepID=A0A5C3NJ17_9AGAM|nr:acyltransferase-domain-containing protein [Heliocybe sulcata]
MAGTQVPVYALPISARPRRTWAQVVNGILFCIVFNLGCLMVNGTQFVFLLPLRLVPLNAAYKLYEAGIRYTKGAFAALLVLMCQWFAPTKLIISFEREGKGRFSDEELEKIVVRDDSGRVVELRLASKAVLIPNHQVYADWWYAWCLMYFMNTHRDVFIVLKKSLKWIPVVGWGMQNFDFIFLARSWASDRLSLSSQLSRLGRRAEKQDIPLSFLLYPEGTLVSADTRPVSKKFADKLGIPDMVHTLLPRSTGLQYSLRSLAPRIPSLQLLDLTVAYPGIPPLGYGQSYYTLRSIFFDRIPPPAIHIHIRQFDVASEVPLGDLSSTNPKVLPNGSAVEIDVPEAEKVAFEDWLRERWRDKDQLMAKYLDTGSFASQDVVEVPVQLRSQREILDAFCFFMPAMLGWTWSKIKQRAL